MSEAHHPADLNAATRIAAAAKALLDGALRLHRQYATGQSPAVDEAVAILTETSLALYRLPAEGDVRRMLLDDPIMYAVYSHGVAEGYRVADANRTRSASASPAGEAERELTPAGGA